MKKFLFWATSLAFVGLFAFAITDSANADEVSENINSQLEIDLDSESSYSQEVLSESGEYLGTLSIEEVPTMQSYAYSYALQNKTYNVSFVGVSVNFGYKATVKNKKIVNAYGAWSNGIIWSTSLGKPYFNSTSSGVKGRTKFGYKDFSWNSTVRVVGYIANNKFWVNLQLS
ncbi:DUF5626 family protein [Enterococcus gilvus]|uniref:DUF5626 family protein n=1 Tax=Enterococcus gilvus TaxID=160453 RepID=UPI003D6A9702